MLKLYRVMPHKDADWQLLVVAHTARGQADGLRGVLSLHTGQGRLYRLSRLARVRDRCPGGDHRADSASSSTERNTGQVGVHSNSPTDGWQDMVV